jgi:hypothetical protein
MNVMHEINQFRYRITLCMLLLAGLAGGCASAEIKESGQATASNTQPAITVKWLPPCKDKIEEPYFALDVYADGKARYVGGEQARERGERIIQLRESEAQGLIASANAIRRGSKSSAFKKTDEHTPMYCLEVTDRSSGKATTVKGNAIETRMQDFISQFRMLESNSKWVCPAIENFYGLLEGDVMTLRGTNVCGNRDEKIFTVDFFDQSGCISNSVGVYHDAVYYYAVKLSSRKGQLGVPATFVAQQHHEITKESFDYLYNVVRRLNLVQEEPLQTRFSSPDDRYTEDYRGRDSADISSLKKEVQQKTGLQWAQMPVGSDSCSEYGNTGIIVLDHSFGPMIQ